jgi:hypothetical protein
VPPSEHQLSIRLPASRKPVGARLVFPASITLVPGPAGSALHGIETRAGRVLGEIDVAFITPELIMDRSGVLLEAARRQADAFVAPPRDGRLLRMGEVRVPAGLAFAVDAQLARGPDGRPPALPYQTVVALGHPDLMLPLAVVVTWMSARAHWQTGEDVLHSLSWTGAPAGAAEEVSPLPFTF